MKDALKAKIYEKEGGTGRTGRTGGLGQDLVRTWSGLGLVKDAKLLCVETETFVVELLVTKLSHWHVTSFHAYLKWLEVTGTGLSVYRQIVKWLVPPIPCHFHGSLADLCTLCHTMLSTEDMMAKNVGSKAAEVVKSMDVDLSRLGSVGFQGKLLSFQTAVLLAYLSMLLLAVKNHSRLAHTTIFGRFAQKGLAHSTASWLLSGLYSWTVWECIGPCLTGWTSSGKPCTSSSLPLSLIPSSVWSFWWMPSSLDMYFGWRCVPQRPQRRLLHNPFVAS